TISGADPQAQFGLTVLTPLVVLLIVGAWRRWPWVNQANVIIGTLVTVFLLVNPLIDTTFSPVVFAPLAITVVVTSSRWTVGTALTVLLLLLVRSNGQGPYVQFDFILSYVFVAGCLYIGRLIMEQSQQALNTALVTAHTEQTLAEQYAQEARAQAVALESRAEELNRLLETLAELETPAVEVAQHVLLAPVVGHLDSIRAEILTSHLLHEIAERRIHTLILDITALTQIDKSIAHKLLALSRSVKLLGSRVIISGISPTIASTLINLGITLDDVQMAPTPYNALQLVEQHNDSDLWLDHA
nr:STAS domain-containing protein [Herpetosiphonaceae bacterium]